MRGDNSHKDSQGIVSSPDLERPPSYCELDPMIITTSLLNTNRQSSALQLTDSHNITTRAETRFTIDCLVFSQSI